MCMLAWMYLEGAAIVVVDTTPARYIEFAYIVLATYKNTTCFCIVLEGIALQNQC